MNDYMLLMHDDAPTAAGDAQAWDAYIGALQAAGHFAGGSSIGSGVCVSKTQSNQPVTAHLTGFMRIRAESIEQAKLLLIGNPVFEAGGTVEIRELPVD